MTRRLKWLPVSERRVLEDLLNGAAGLSATRRRAVCVVEYDDQSEMVDVTLSPPKGEDVNSLAAIVLKVFLDNGADIDRVAEELRRLETPHYEAIRHMPLVFRAGGE